MWCSVEVQCQTPDVLVLEPFGKGSHERQGQPLPVTGPGLPDKIYKAICGWSLPVLDLKTCEKGREANRS